MFHGYPQVAFALIFLVAGVLGTRAYRKAENINDKWRRAFFSWLLRLAVLLLFWAVLSEPIRTILLPPVRFVRCGRVQELAAIRLLPDNCDTLPGSVEHPIDINDGEAAVLIFSLLHDARQYTNTHPNTIWYCRLELLTDDGREFYCRVSSTKNNGVVFEILPSANAWMNIGEYRMDALGPILERVIYKDNGG